MLASRLSFVVVRRWVGRADDAPVVCSSLAAHPHHFGAGPAPRTGRDAGCPIHMILPSGGHPAGRGSAQTPMTPAATSESWRRRMAMSGRVSSSSTSS
ncbi:hypothetical protein ACFPRL_21310 [Pseudoclavibacter helvolus]